MSETHRLYNPYLDIFKIFAAVSVCFLHYGFDGDFGKVVEALARFAVPFFFLISGWYTYRPDNKYKIFSKDKISRTVCLAILMESIYITYHATTIGYNLIYSYILPAKLVKGLFGIYGVCGVGWFVYSLLICYVVSRYFDNRYINLYFGVSSLLIMAHIVLNCTIMVHIESDEYVSNALFMGIPFFMLGMCLRKNWIRIKEIRYIVFVGLFVVGALESIFVVLAFGARDLYIGSVLMSVSLLLLANKLSIFSQKCVGGGYTLHSSFRGASFYVYLFIPFNYT